MKKKLSAVMLFVLGALAMVVFQQVGQTAPALTALDYAEIDQLYARYSFAADTGDAEMFAETFTDDGVFDVTNPAVDDPRGPWVPIQGYDALLAWRTAVADRAVMPKGPRHYTTNILPTAEGARGSAYAVLVANPPTDEPPQRVLAKATYHDQLVKTPDGWRFKKRSSTWGTFADELLQALAQ